MGDSGTTVVRGVEVVRLTSHSLGGVIESGEDSFLCSAPVGDFPHARSTSMYAVVTKVEVQSVPFGSEEHGDRWDLFSGPDLYYKAYDPDGERIHTSEVVGDVQPTDLPVTLDAGFVLKKTGRYTLQLLDADLIEDEVVGQVGLAPDRMADQDRGGPSAVAMSPDDGDTALRMWLKWKEHRT